MRRGRAARLAAALAFLAALVPAAAPAARAAPPDLTLTSETRYEVDPAAGQIHVSVELTAVNHLVDTRTRQYYFDRAFLAVQPGATNFAISARTGSPTVAVSAANPDHTLLRIDFGRRLPAGSSRTFSLTFDLVDPGGAATRETRIGESLVSFGAWSFATPETPGGRVTVVFPAGYVVDVESGQIGAPSTDGAGRTVFTSGRLADPLAFFAYFVADRPSAYVESIRQVELGGEPLGVSIQAWPDDPAWAERVGGLVVRALPVLAGRIGLDWTAADPLVVRESISRSAVGHSGRYDPVAGEIEIAYYAASFVVLHETSHAWFDGSLLAERWANEGFASWFALQAAAELGEPAAAEPLTPELEAVAFPLNDWPVAGDARSQAESYGYAASAELARLIAERAGPDALAGVWRAARDRIAAYQPAGLEAGPGTSGRPPIATEGADAARVERSSGAPDWRGLLDLLEDRTGRRYDDLWRRWVVRPAEAALLDARATARKRYDEVVARAGDWQLPPAIRQAMRAWQFGQATELLDAADRALADRDLVEATASAAGLDVPRTLEAAFEASRGFAAAAAEADAQVATIEAYETARAVRPIEPDFFEEVGLWWASPDADIERAAAAFELGDLQASVDASAAAYAAWTGAADLGRNRVASILGALVAAAIGVWLVVSTIRGLWRSGARQAARVRSGRRAARQAHPLTEHERRLRAARGGPPAAASSGDDG